VRNRHQVGCRVVVERAADRYTLICDGPVSDRELAAVPLRRHDWHGEWDYTVLPTAA
jgi:hypothetical protein